VDVSGPATGPDDHLDLATLAELDEDLLGASEAHLARRHLSGCAQCRDGAGQLRATRALLSSLPVDTMPALVAARIDTALASAAKRPPMTKSVRGKAGRRRRWLTSPALAGAAAAVAAVALVAGLVVSRSGSGHPNKPSSAGVNRGIGEAAPASAVKQWQTGANYTKANIAALVPGIVVGIPTPLPSPTALANGPDKAAGPSATNAATASFTQRQLRSLAALTQCAALLNAGTPVQPLSVDYASYNGKPATIVVFPSHDDVRQLDVWVVRSVCSSGSLDLVFYRVPRPAGA
jgi:hypothetical protein